MKTYRDSKYQRAWIIVDSAWILTFSDLLLLLLTIFVMRYSTFRTAKEDLIPIKMSSSDKIIFSDATPDFGLETDVKSSSKSNSNSSNKKTSDDIRILIPESGLIKGSEELTFHMVEAVNSIIKVTSKTNWTIHITSVDPSWELASARAVALMRQIYDAGVSMEAVNVSVYADTRVECNTEDMQSLQHLSCIIISANSNL